MFNEIELRVHGSHNLQKCDVSNSLKNHYNFCPTWTNYIGCHKWKLTDKDRRILSGIAAKHHKSKASKQIWNNSSVTQSQQKLQKLHTAGVYDRADHQEPLVSKPKEQRYITWCNDHKSRTPEQRNTVIWSDESYFTLFLVSRWVYSCKNPQCLLLTAERGGRSLVVWGVRGSRGVIKSYNIPACLYKGQKIWGQFTGPGVPYGASISPDTPILQHDNAHIHTDKLK